MFFFIPVAKKKKERKEKKIYALGFDEFLESTFCILLVVESFPLQRVVEILEVVVGWWEIKWIRWMRQKFVDREKYGEE